MYTADSCIIGTPKNIMGISSGDVKDVGLKQLNMYIYKSIYACLFIYNRKQFSFLKNNSRKERCTKMLYWYIYIRI